MYPELNRVQQDEVVAAAAGNGKAAGSQAANFTATGDKRIMKIRDSRILVTGGCGLIGSTTIDLLLREHDAGARSSSSTISFAARLATSRRRCSDPRVELVQGDIRDVEHASTR